MKLCRSCKTEKPFEEMKKDKRYLDGRSFTCKQCSRIYESNRKSKNIEYKRFSKKERLSWPENHQICRSCREILPFEKFGKNKNKEFGIENMCKECRKPISKAYYAKWLKNNAEMRMFVSARNRSKKENIPFSITAEDIKIPEYCPVLGIKLDREGGKCNDSTPSLDKFIPELGYTKENINVISWRANWIKQNSTIAEIEKLYFWMKKFQNTLLHDKIG